MSPRSGAISTSFGPRLLICWSTVCLPRKLISCAVTLSAEVISSRFSGGVEMLTAMMTSPHSLRASSIGRLLAMPPSTSSRPSISTGAIAPGTDMLARMACARLPWSSTTDSPVSMSVAIARNGIGSLLKSPMPNAGVDELAEEGLDRHAGDHALRQREAVLDAELGLEQRHVVVDLAPDRDLLARRRVAEDRVPVGREHRLLHLLRRASRRKCSADDGAHARAGDTADRNPHLFEHLQHADMGDAARTTARKRKPDPRRGRRRRDRPFRRGCGSTNTFRLCGDRGRKDEGSHCSGPLQARADRHQGLHPSRRATPPARYSLAHRTGVVP